MLSIVIPVYNEIKNIDFVLKEIYSSIDEKDQYEIIFVDDHSEDNTYLHIRDINKVNKNVKILRLSKRSGSHVAVKAGIDSSSGDKVLVIAGDGQEDPKLINEMSSKISNGADIVWGVREKRSEPIISRFVTKFFYRGLIKFTKQSISYSVDISNADFYMIGKKVIDAVKEVSLNNSSLFGLLAWIGFTQESVTYQRRERKSGLTKWGVKRKFGLAVDWYIAFSPSPTRFIIYTVITIAILALAYASLIIINYFEGSRVEGWASIAVMMLFFNSLIVLILGINSEYMWRTYVNTSSLPSYTIEDKIL